MCECADLRKGVAVGTFESSWAREHRLADAIFAGRAPGVAVRLFSGLLHVQHSTRYKLYGQKEEANDGNLGHHLDKVSPGHLISKQA